MKKLLFTLLCAILALSVLMGALVSCNNTDKTDDKGGNETTENNNESDNTDENETKYNEALAFIANGRYEEAYEAFKALGDYKDSLKYLSRFIYLPSAVTYALSDRSGVMNVTFGKYNMPCKVVAVGDFGKKETTLTFDDIGNLKRQEVKYNDDLMAYDYSYDADNRQTAAVYSLNGAVIHIYNYTYDELGQLIKSTYTEEGVLLDEYIYFYDENGNHIQSLHNADGITRYTYTYTYNEDGNMTREHREKYNGSCRTSDYIYDANGKLIQEIYTKDDEQTIIDYTYDTAGNCIKEECTYPDGTTAYLTREYDANGNVIQEMQVDADGAVESVETQFALCYMLIDIPAETKDIILSSFAITTEY